MRTRPVTDDAEGWRAENDRHRALYVEAAKERDQLRAVVSRFRKANRAIDAAIEDESVDMVADELIAEHRDALDAVLDGSPDTGDDDAMVSVPLSWSDQYDELKAERDRLREAIDADRPMQIANLKALIAERDELRAVVDALLRHRDADALRTAVEDADEDTQRSADSAAAGYWQEVVDALVALDGSPDTGDGEEVR
jgi:hypothetical protein